MRKRLAHGLLLSLLQSVSCAEPEPDQITVAITNSTGVSEPELYRVMIDVSGTYQRVNGVVSYYARPDEIEDDRPLYAADVSVEDGETDSVGFNLNEPELGLLPGIVIDQVETSGGLSWPIEAGVPLHPLVECLHVGIGWNEDYQKPLDYDFSCTASGEGLLKIDWGNDP